MKLFILFNIMFGVTYIHKLLYKTSVNSYVIPLSKSIHFLFPKKNVNLNKQCDSSKQLYFLKNSNMLFSHDQSDIYIQKNEFIKNKKIISISRGGYKGFYLMGIVSFIKQHYPLDSYIFSGASAGAWNALFMSYKHDPMLFVGKIMESVGNKTLSLREIEGVIKKNLLKSYTNQDFDLRRLFIGITTIDNFQIKTNIFSDFDDLEDALDCCIGSSHIPLITGGFTNKYHNMYAFDGAFSRYPYLNISKPTLHISASMWNNTEKKHCKTELINYYSMFSKDNIDFTMLYKQGYNDAYNHKTYLDGIFL